MKNKTIVLSLLAFIAGIGYLNIHTREFGPSHNEGRHREIQIGDMVDHEMYCETTESGGGRRAGGILSGIGGATLLGGAIGGSRKATGIGAGLLGVGLLTRAASGPKTSCYWRPLDSNYKNDTAFWQRANRRDRRQYRDGDVIKMRLKEKRRRHR